MSNQIKDVYNKNNNNNKLRMSCWSSMHLAIFRAPNKVLYNSPATFQY